jgi:carbon-monoxide dehydrogenase medium subunit
MKVFDTYHLPGTVDEALAFLAQYEGRARVIAGGTDLLVDTQAEMHHGQRPHFDALIDVTQIDGANQIREDGGYIEIGCGVTHTQLVESPLIQARATALAEACHVVGGPQVRNVATLCGNVAHALPAADGTVALMALGAEARIAYREGDAVMQEWRPLAALFRGPGESAVDATREMIAAIRFRGTTRGQGSAFARVMRPQGVALPIIGMATRVACELENGEWTLVEVAVSAGPVAPVPFRAVQTEAFLRGKSIHAHVTQEASRLLLGETSPRTSAHRATKEYRVELLPMLLTRTLEMAVERAMHAS